MRRWHAVLRGAVLGAVSATLAACATGGKRGPGDNAAVAAPDAPRPVAAAAKRSPTPTTEASGAATPVAPPPAAPDFWTRIVGGLRFGRCDAHPAVLAEARRYAAGGRFTRTLESMLPKMAFVLDEVERRGLPTEFVLLPIVESHYRLLPARGNRPAGPWQLVPSTARAHGIEIRADYDGRLDLAASTGAALEHIERLADRFGDDWTAVVKAYNAGEYRVRRARDGVGATAAYRGLSATTLAHHARLHALACIVAEPERFGIALPTPQPRSRLSAFAVDADLDLDLAAAASGVERGAIVSSNPGIRGERAPKGSHLVLPEPAVVRLRTRVEAIPSERRAHWRPRATAGSDWPSLAAASGLDPASLAAANGATADRPPPARILMPVPDSGDVGAQGSADSYIVRAGDSPWTIARRLRVRLADLLSINGLDGGSVLKPGQRLRVP